MTIVVATSEHADGHLAETLADLLGHAGHDVHTIPVQELQHAEHLRHTQALILVTADAELPDVAAHISDLARPGLIVAHTSLWHSFQVLDDAEVAGALVGSLAPIGDDTWAIDGANELITTILELLVGELKCNFVELEPAERRIAVLRRLWHGLSRAVARRADPSVHVPALPWVGDLDVYINSFPEGDHLAKDLTTLIGMVAAWNGDADAELWALGKATWK